MTDGSELGTRAPKGESVPSLDPAGRRLAAQAEPHTRAYLSESVAATPGAASWARHLVGAFAAGAGIHGQRLEDVRLAISEAVTNAVSYAYDEDAGGKVHVMAAVVSGELWLVVADDGNGMRTRAGTTRGLGLGLGLMAQLSDSLTILSRSTGGVEIRMRFDLCAEA